MVVKGYLSLEICADVAIPLHIDEMGAGQGEGVV